MASKYVLYNWSWEKACFACSRFFIVISILVIADNVWLSNVFCKTVFNELVGKMDCKENWSLLSNAKSCGV